ncbi:MAG: energy-coupling factor transporter transmembrane protein EcfT [Deltaproteobacteria bacterium]|nr:energy-coupling factor transporter transmembrane protein EcfT [Deltaproteobacteria bacterium]MBW2048913.1 energy-coupling factor transporter transmembrane protein EcfT [Deltaproteobacteria bacterium]MBW2111275.1 energy-coupling factor transporter transmembrane protein EcfT [Deltaproteobacteria bacterium]MBW2353471.1 energy-coupling factor transporter transmembrane protein EcfT [Deltaproteobacteria bacterium]HDZ89694.1 energy-coupling factor transporter transmembrane protein EcfT [Deltaproteo
MGINTFDPRTKLALGVMGIATILITGDTWPLVVELCLIFTGLFLVKGAKPMRALKLILPLVGLVFVIGIISFPPETAVKLALRLFNLLAVSALFFQAMDPAELGDGFRKIGFPYEFSFILTTSLRYVPLIGRRIRLIMDAQRARGIDLRPRIRNIPRFLALLMPLLVQAFVLAEQLAMAMESRGFARKGRTFRRQYRITPKEYIIMALALGILVIFFAWQKGWWAP